MSLSSFAEEMRKLKAAFMIYTAWNIWKERNRRVFDQKQGSPPEVLQEINGGLELSLLLND